MKSRLSPKTLAPLPLAAALAACLALAGPAVADEHAKDARAKKDEPCAQEKADARAEAVTKDAAAEADEGRRKPKESWTSGASTSDLSPKDTEGEGEPDADGQR